MPDQLSGKTARSLPSLDEIDAMKPFGNGNPECDTLCVDLRLTWDDLQNASPDERPRLIARIKALNAQMKALHCPRCLPE
jgi:hypothetical protein